MRLLKRKGAKIRIDGVHAESVFKELLSLERKRTERTGAPFLLLLIDISKTDTTQNTAEKAARALALTTRQTDIKGWYSRDSVIGVIHTNMSPSEMFAVRDKVACGLGESLGREAAGKVEITARMFPETAEPYEPDRAFYPDISGGSGGRYFLIKRALDIAGSITALFLFAPLFASIALLIKISSRGPVLYKQERVGFFGRRFIFLKFRSMRADSDETVHREYIRKLIAGSDEVGRDGIYKIKDDARVTSLGRFLRKSSLDELPQFINVLRGEMSLVGPRPPIPYEIESYALWHRQRFLRAKPGITGLWQVKGRSSTSFDDMVRLDLKYTSRRSFWLDIRLLVQTPFAVLAYKGAY